MTPQLTEFDCRLLQALEPGLPLVPEPYAALAEALGCDEATVLARIAILQKAGTISRFGVVVRHHELGICANAMVVWDLPQARAETAGECLASLPFVTLCYQRPRRLPDWPYNLFCMIHGRNRDAVLWQAEIATAVADLERDPRAVLFSKRRFKQRGARYGTALENKGEAA